MISHIQILYMRREKAKREEEASKVFDKFVGMRDIRRTWKWFEILNAKIRLAALACGVLFQPGKLLL